MKTMRAAHVRTQAMSPEPYAIEVPSMVEMRSGPAGLMVVASSPRYPYVRLTMIVWCARGVRCRGVSAED